MLTGSCVNTMALIVWVLSVDKLGRRWFVAVGQTIAVFSCFTVGGLWYTGASSGNAAAGTALVSQGIACADLELFICCVWTFSFQFVAKSYYLYSAEIPSAVLRSEYQLPLSLMSSQDRPRNVFHQLDHRYCDVLRHTTSSPCSEPQSWVCLWCIVGSHVYPRMAVHP